MNGSQIRKDVDLIAGRRIGGGGGARMEAHLQQLGSCLPRGRSLCFFFWNITSKML